VSTDCLVQTLVGAVVAAYESM